MTVDESRAMLLNQRLALYLPIREEISQFWRDNEEFLCEMHIFRELSPI